MGLSIQVIGVSEFQEEIVVGIRERSMGVKREDVLWALRWEEKKLWKRPLDLSALIPS